MTKVHLLTIGTEITSGEVVNANASWLSLQIEMTGVRVHSHLTVRDQRDEMLKALHWPLSSAETEPGLVFVTGGLGPTSDDMTRACVAEHLGLELEFDENVWQELKAGHEKRGLPIREAHKHQCWFPKGSVRLKNPVGTALGFYCPATLGKSKQPAHYFVLPGPPRELEGMYREEVLPRLQKLLPKPDLIWHRWSVFAVPESEVAELVEPLIAGSGLEVGYRAQIPYVRVKLFAHPQRHKEILARVGEALKPNLVSQTVDGEVSTKSHDLAEQLLKIWPDAELPVWDEVSDGLLAQRLYAARRALGNGPGVQVRAGGLSLKSNGQDLLVEVHCSRLHKNFEQKLPFKISLDSERGRKAAAEWALWLAVRAF